MSRIDKIKIIDRSGEKLIDIWPEEEFISNEEVDSLFNGGGGGGDSGSETPPEPGYRYFLYLRPDNYVSGLSGELISYLHTCGPGIVLISDVAVYDDNDELITNGNNFYYDSNSETITVETLYYIYWIEIADSYWDRREH